MTPAGIVLCGGGALTVGIERAARQTLSMPVRIGVPKEVSGLVDDVLTPEFATPIGLVLYGQKNEVEPATSFSLGRIGKSFQKIPFKGVVGRAVDFIKSFLP